MAPPDPDAASKLLEPLALGPRSAPNRVMFGPHETNLAWGRALSDRHVAYYAARALGGCGTIVVEEASVHPSDHPYERCPDAALASDGWAKIVQVCRPLGSLVLAAIGHTGGQGSSAFSQRELWAPSDEPEVNSGEVPKIMEQEDIDAVVAGFGRAAAAAAAADLDGVEINAGQNSLVRQFLSGLTNRRQDRYGEDRATFVREVIDAVRGRLGPDRIVGLRLSCDELAPWAGITPDAAADLAADLASSVDYLVVVRGAIFSLAETRPTGHHGIGFNLELTSSIRSALDGAVPVFAQGSIVDPDLAEQAVTNSVCDGVEMTRAQIAAPDLVAAIKAGRQPRPCVLCNQRCKVRDNRNPIIGCIAEPGAGHETIDPHPIEAAEQSRRLLVVGAGPAGLELARVAAARGHQVTVYEAAAEAGGMLRTVAKAPGHHRFGLLADWLVADAVDRGVEFHLGKRATAAAVAAWDGPVVLATGGCAPGHQEFQRSNDAVIVDPDSVLNAEGLDGLVPSSVAIWDPVGNGVGIAVAEHLAASGRAVTFVTPDPVAGTLLSLTGDLAGSNVRLQQAGVVIERRRRLRSVAGDRITVEHVMAGSVDEIAVEAVVDCSPRTADDALWTETGASLVRVGDSVAARTVAEAIREGRAAALALSPSSSPSVVEAVLP